MALFTGSLNRFGRYLMLCFLLFYFALVFIYVLPANPLRETLSPLLNATMETYLPQDWNLFAPVPRTADLALLVRPLTSTELKQARVHGLPKDGWYNLSAPLWTQFQQSRFSAYNRLGRPADQAIVHYLNNPQPQAVQLMVKVASAFCKDLGLNKTSFLALAIYERQSKLWSDRARPKQRVVNTVFVGVYPLDRNVEQIQIYQREGHA